MAPRTWIFQFLFYFLQYQVVASSSSPLSSFASSARPLCRQDQRFALLQFKHTITIKSNPSWNYCDNYVGGITSWDENATDCCNWDRVTCDRFTGHVIELDLRCNQLYGTVPKSLGNLKQIRILDLSRNGLNGEFQSTISNLRQFTWLDLSFNNFEDRIPVLAELTKLESLDLHYNHFIGGFPLWVANLKPRFYLSLSSNQLTGPIPFNLSGLQNLQTLYLYRNSLSGVIPPLLFTLPSLLILDLSSNNLTGQIPEFQLDLPLVGLILGDNKLHGPIPRSISTLVNLSVLNLASTDLSGVVDTQLPKNLNTLNLSNTSLSVAARGNVSNTLPNLESFFMTSCNIEVFPYFLRASERLFQLDLSQNRIRGQIPNWVNGLFGKALLQYLNLNSNLLQGPLPIPPPHIQSFYISNNNLSGGISSFFCNARYLQILDLSHNKLSGAVPQCLRNFSSALSVLNLHSNRFTGTLPPLEFAKPNRLRSLDLSGNQFEGPLPRSLVDCTSLEVLNVGNNKINDTFPHWLETLPQFQVLVIRSNQFHGPIDTSNSKFPFPKLRIADLSYNEFSGHLPMRYFEYFQAMKNKTMPDKKYMSDEYSYYHDSIIVTLKGIEIEMQRIFTIFTTIDFSSNNFSGEIPNVIGKLNSLIVLNISHNSLTSHIPKSLGNLTSLESLDISSNKLSRRIPSQLASLTFLEVLNLSCNRLHGPIPHGPQFNTFQNGSYAGNLGLCGLPLSKECEVNQTKVQPPVLQQEEDGPIFDGFFWKIVVIGYGCGMTLGLFLGSLMFLIDRPKFFVRLAEREMPKTVIRLRRMVTDTMARRK